MDKVPPASVELETIDKRLQEISSERASLQKDISEKHQELQRLGVEIAATRDRSHLDAPREAAVENIQILSAQMDSLRSRLAEDKSVSRSLEERATRLKAGERDPVRAHIGRAMQPASEDELRVSRVAEAWAAISVSLMLISFLGIAVFQGEHLISGLVFSIALFAFVEAGFRGRLVNLVFSVNIGLAVAATLIILFEFFWEIVVAGVLIVGLYVLWDNLRELRR